MGGVKRGVATVALLFGCALPAIAADPILMLLLSVAREIAFNAARERLTAPAKPAVEVTTYPGTRVEPVHVRRMVDEAFSYLSETQRQEVFDSLHAGLMDPKNAAVRSSMIDYFADRAFAVREAHNRLANLSQPEKARLAAEFKQQVAGLSGEETAQLADLLRRNVLPVPSDLTEMLLAALGER